MNKINYIIGIDTDDKMHVIDKDNLDSIRKKSFKLIIVDETTCAEVFHKEFGKEKWYERACKALELQ